MAKILLDGQAIVIPDEVAQTDDGLIRALTPLYPDVANAEIARKQENGETVITVVKRPGPKGAAHAHDASESRTSRGGIGRRAVRSQPRGQPVP